MSKILTFDQWKKKHNFNKIKIYKSFKNQITDGQDINDVIKVLQKIKKENKDLDNMFIDLETERGYYDDIYTKILISGSRKETDEEYENRLKNKYNDYVKVEEKERLQYEALKKKYGK